MRRIIYFLTFSLLVSTHTVQADEGMWLPMFLKKLNYAEMQGKGLKLTPEEIYNVNNSSLKDAIVRLGRGFCSGEMISDQGLFLTNHHCGYDVIQEKSSTENDYLTNGFWAMSRKEELPAGFAVSYLVRMEDVSEMINKDLNEEMSEVERAKKVRELKKKIISENKEKDENGYDFEIKGFYKGNEYYMLVYDIFPDVRLVGAPPSAIGKHGGDTDNWMWPRHTGDFTMFRVYANKDNRPAEYSKDNMPYKPKHHLPISMKGVEQGDYAMIFGYPGSTDRYLTSYGVKLATDIDQPAKVKIRRKKLDLYEEGQAKSDKIRIQYASKHAGVSNYWKYYIGQTRGLKRLNIYEKKKAQEDAFQNWIKNDSYRMGKYGQVIKNYEKAYNILNKVQLARTYWFEAIYGVEIIQYGFSFQRLKGVYNKIDYLKSKMYKKEESYTKLSKEDQKKYNAEIPAQIEGLEGQIPALIAAIKATAPEHFKDYNAEIDQNVLAAMVKFYDEDLADEYKPKQFVEMISKYKGDYKAFAQYVFDNTSLSSQEKLDELRKNPSKKAVDKDVVITLSEIFLNFYRTEIPAMFTEAQNLKTKADRLYVAGLREQYPNKSFAPDANSTMRVTYGNVLDYEPKDGVKFYHFTTLDGILEKASLDNKDYVIPERLKTLAENKDYGKYADKDGTLHTCFLSNNDITGGNSGSGVINAKGELIGTAFDGNWEAMSGDIAFETELQRTISVDVRYTLWVIDKYAGAGHLIEEMDLVWEDEKEEATKDKVENKK